MFTVQVNDRDSTSYTYWCCTYIWTITIKWVRAYQLYNHIKWYHI